MAPKQNRDPKTMKQIQRDLEKKAKAAEKVLNGLIRNLDSDAKLEVRVQYMGQRTTTGPEQYIQNPKDWVVGEGEWHS